MTIEMMEKAVSRTDKKYISNLMNNIVQDVWKRLELRRSLIARQLAMEMIENAISLAEERSTREIIDEIMQEGWRRIEVNSLETNFRLRRGGPEKSCGYMNPETEEGRIFD